MKWNETDIYKKVQNQEVVPIDTIFRITKEPINVDMTDSEIQEKFEQELAMKKALRDQDFTNNTVGRKIEGVPQNFNQLWEQNTRN